MEHRWNRWNEAERKKKDETREKNWKRKEKLRSMEKDEWKGRKGDVGKTVGKVENMEEND